MPLDLPTVAIVGAGPGLGLATARRFGSEGLPVALVSRNQAHVDALATELRDDGITAAGYAADVRHRPALTDALARARDDLGPVGVVVYCPAVSEDWLHPLAETSHDVLADALDFSLHGARTAVDAVLPGMRDAGSGTILVVNGATAVQPRADFAGTSIAFAAERVLVELLHHDLAESGVHVAQLVIPGAIEAGHRDKDPDVLADTLWSMHRERSTVRVLATPLDSTD